jgi:hypothetical protein
MVINGAFSIYWVSCLAIFDLSPEIIEAEHKKDANEAHEALQSLLHLGFAALSFFGSLIFTGRFGARLLLLITFIILCTLGVLCC